METFKKIYNDFNYTYQKRLAPNETVTCAIPKPTGKNRSVKSISWYGATDVTGSATLASNYTSAYARWETLKDNALVSPSVTAIEFKNPTNFYREVFVWVVME